MSDSDRFPTTQWSQVRRACADDRATARRALGQFLSQYLQALRTYLRVRGHKAGEIDGLLQGFVTDKML